jgi:hypothetical protein
MIHKKATFQKLKVICHHYQTKEGIDVNKVMAEHEKQIALSTPYFIKKGLSLDDARGVALALSIYTGAVSSN